MAVIKSPKSLSLIIKVADGINEKGDIIYKRKTFSNISPTATPQSIHNVAMSIRNVIAKTTVSFHLSETSLLQNE